MAVCAGYLFQHVDGGGDAVFVSEFGRDGRRLGQVACGGHEVVKPWCELVGGEPPDGQRWRPDLQGAESLGPESLVAEDGQTRVGRPARRPAAVVPAPP